MSAGGALQRQFEHGCRSLDASWVKRLFMEGGAVMATSPIDNCVSMEDLQDWLEQRAWEMGFDGARYVHIGHCPQTMAVSERSPLRFVSTLNNGEDVWRAGDPALPQIAHLFAPFVWTARDDTSLPDMQRAWLSIERLRGVDAGIVIPVQDYVFGPAYISLFSLSPRQAEAALELRSSQMFALAIEFHIRAKQLISTRPGRAGALSDRELSCLRHAASGATLAETAASLGIAVRTVELHFSRAAKKLGAANRINAVAIAIGAGLINV